MTKLTVTKSENSDRKIKTEKLVIKMKEGDEHAFKELYFMYAPYISTIIYTITGNDIDLDDILQESFLEAFRSIKNLRENTKFKAWMSTITVRTCMRWLKKKYKIRFLSYPVDILPDLKEKTDYELKKHLYSSLDTLSPKIRIPWVLHYIEELSINEVAEICEVSLATTKRRIKKASDILRRRLQNE